jgi:Protein of unknown function (DUF1385)
VERRELESVLAHADAAGRLPRLGGMARPDGVVIASERYWAFAGVDGSLREGTTPSPPRALRVPLLRGLARLGLALAPLLRRGGVAGTRERLLLAAALLAPLAFVVLPQGFRTIAAVVLALVVLAWLFRGRTLRLHGAEHRAIAAVEARSLGTTWTGEARPSRFALRCGTNFAALALPVAAMAEWLWPLSGTAYTPALVALLSLALTMEVWLAIERSTRRLARVLLWPGLGLQRLTTREPALAETRVALAAAASVLRRELAA